MKCWGSNLLWKTGDPPGALTIATPADIAGQSNVGVLAAGSGFQCSLAGDGRVQCWGDNSAGQSGTGTLAPPYIPADVVDQDAILAVTTTGTGGGQVIPFPGTAGGNQQRVSRPVGRRTQLRFHVHGLGEREPARA